MDYTNLPWLASLMLERFNNLLDTISKKRSVERLDILSFNINQYFDPVSRTYFFMHSKIECDYFECDKCSSYKWNTTGHCKNHKSIKDCKYCTYMERVYIAQAEIFFKHKRLIPDNMPFDCSVEIYNFKHQKEFSTIFGGIPNSIITDPTRAILCNNSAKDVIKEYKIITCGPECTTL